MSSSSEDSDAGRKRKRKVRRLEDSPASTSSASPIIGNSSLRRRRRLRADRSSNESDHSPILTNHRRKIMKVSSDSESENDSDSDIGHSRITKPRPLETDSDTDDGSSSQWESDFSDHETDMLPNNSTLPTSQNDSESEFSDGQSEKCPICLVSFKRQEIGTPESCDHTFCLECIQEWSKNMNTCPVDRQEYSLILVRDHLNGKVTRQIPIERPVPQNEVDIFEDPTFCEICGSNDQEDRMLLCDGCDLGFHLFCLTPPLSEVPAGSWYCNDCFSNSDNNSSVDVFELQLLFQEDDNPVEHQLRPQRRTRSTRNNRSSRYNEEISKTPKSNLLRLIPRTRQTERIRRRVENNRHQNALANQMPQTNPSTENSRNINRVTSSTSRTKRSKRKSRKSKSAKIKYRTVYKIDKVTGLTVAVKKRVHGKRKKTTKRRVAKPKTVKTRLAQQLGMCAPRTTNQNLPDVKIPNRASSASGNISGIRHDAGIPTLHLFGQNNDLDYFTDEDEYSLGSQVLIRRAPTRSDVASIRRTLTRKNILVPEVVSSTSDLLDSILCSQEQLYARNASYSIDSSGKFKIDAKSKPKNYIDVTKEQVKGKETPYYNPNRNYNRYNQNQNNYNRPYQNRYQRPSNNYYHSNNQNYNNYNTEPSSSMNYSNYSNDGGDDYPQDYSRRTLCATSDPNSEENEEERNQNEESELDIYSDIETVTTTKAEESEYRPLSPPPLPNFSSMGCLEDDNDSEPDMVIDDEKIQEQDNQNDYNAETAVSSTVGFERAVPVHSGPVPFPTLMNQTQSDPVQSSLDTIKSSYQYYNEDSSDGCPNANIYSREPPKPPNDEDADSDDGCPNFSIYSKESKTMALHTDISGLSTEKQEFQVGEVSSSPNFESQHCEDQQPDLPSSDQMYDPEETFNETEDEENVDENQEETILSQNQEKSVLDEKQAEESAPNENQEKEEEETVADETKEQYLNEPQEQSPDENEEQHLDEIQHDSDQLYNPEALYSPDRDIATPVNLDYTYDPENCIRTDETLNTDVEKTIDADHTIFDPENTYDETNDSIDRTADMEKAIFGFKKSDNNDTTTEDRYDPALPFSDDIDDPQINNTEEAKVIDGEATIVDPQSPPINESSTSMCEPAEDEIKKADNDNDEKKIKPKKNKTQSNLNSLYSDSEDDESVVKKGENAFVMNDINQMTEDISEEERSYTPCLDEKSQKEGLEGLDTELISDEDRNDFDEANELKTAYDGDALEINAKESELDFARPEDYEEGEIVDKNKEKETPEDEPAEEPNNNVTEQSTSELPPPETVKKSKKRDNREKSPERERERDKGNNKENENSNRNSFKRLSKSNKDRNYRDKEKRPSSPKGRSKERDYNNKKDKRKEKRREIERYNVRAIISEKPRPLIAKDQFGRDIRNTPSRSKSRSYTPPLRSSSGPVRSPSKSRRSRSRSRRSLSRHRSLPKEKTRKRRKSRSRNFRSASRSRSPQHKKGPPSVQKAKKRKRSDDRYRKRKSDDKFGKSKRRVRSRSRHVSRSASPIRRPRARERLDWTPMDQPQMSPSWTPPRVIDNAQLLRNKNLTVTVNNSKKKKDRRKRRNKDTLETRQKKRRQERDRTPPLSKEVFASGDNILVSVSFNNDNEVRDITTRDKRKNDEINKRRKKKKNRRDLSGIKPVAIIDLDRSPFRELTPSPKQIIVLTDSENEENEVRRRNIQGSGICDSSQQVASPERGIGPKTPPEPQVKFSLAPKPPQIRAINNPLIDPEEIEISVSNEMTSRISPGIHKGPNTPPEPPNSPPSSPDAYDPFEPTKSRSPTPGPQSQDGTKEKHDSIDSRAAIDLLEKSMNPMPEINKSLTPPLADIQPADSQSSVQVVTPDSNIDKSPDRPQLQTAQQTSKPVAQTIPFSSVPTPLNSSTPIVTNLPPSRINILNSTVISPPVASPIPQRIVLPNQIKSSSVKISPTKATIKSTPIKPMLSKTTTTKFTTRKRTQNGSADDVLLDFDSPYSPGSSDYEDLFEPPSEIVTKPVIKGKAKTVQKHPLSAFDALFGGSPSYKKKKYPTKKISGSGKTKTVGVKLDEDNLKILDELPNSAVEMQVKDKFLKKLNRQERVVEEVKLVLKPHYNKKRINKEEYKDILRRSVPKICHNKSGEINPTKIKNLIEAYVRKIRHSKKVTSSSNINPLKM